MQTACHLLLSWLMMVTKAGLYQLNHLSQPMSWYVFCSQLIIFYQGIYLQRVLPPDQILHCNPETEEEASCMIDLLYAEKTIFKATKRLANAQALESNLHMNFYRLQSNKAVGLMQKADLDIGIATLAAMKWGLYHHPTLGAILHSQKYHRYCQSLW